MAPSRPPPRSTPCESGIRLDDPRLPVAGTGSLSGVRKSNRARWRAAVLIGVHVLIALHVTHFLVAGRTLSPVEPSESMYTLELGHLNAGFVFFAAALAATLLFGRFFCGWGCHIVALQDLCAWIMKKLGVRPRPFRARLLAFAPAVAAFYMFAWPTLVRLAAGGPENAFPGFSNHLMTTDLWATFPGPLFSILTFAACGFAAVYFLGSKGFCTYGCPYGALFAGVDRLSPGRIVASDACDQCGHCTATCTSNVRVHEEVRLFQQVVDSGCMKCTDCVSVCPKEALRFSFAVPALFTKPVSQPRARRYDLTWPEELLAAAVALVATLAFRDLYNGPPLLLSVGLGAITAFLALKVVHLIGRPDVRVQNLDLKTAGRIEGTGWAIAVLSAFWLAFTAHSAFVQWHRAWGRHALDRTEVSRADGLSGAFRSKSYSEAHAHALADARRHFTLADRWGLAGVVEVKLGLAWCDILAGDFTAARRRGLEALDLAPDREELRRNLADIEAAAGAAGSPCERAGALAQGERWQEAAAAYEICLARDPGSFPDLFNYGGVLRRLGRAEAAIEPLEAARKLAPDDADVCVELGLAYRAVGRTEQAIEAFERAIELRPDTPESRLYLPGLIEELRRTQVDRRPRSP